MAENFCIILIYEVTECIFVCLNGPVRKLNVRICVEIIDSYVLILIAGYLEKSDRVERRITAILTIRNIIERR